MEGLFIDRLIAAVREKRAPICVGIDPIIDMFPESLRPKDARDLDASVDAVFAFCSGALKAVAQIAPVVKFQSAYFEKYLWQGVEAYYSLIHEAKSLGLLVIGDVKRGDIGSTSEAYAAAHLSELEFSALDDVATPDAITVNPFLGMDTLEPYLEICRDEGQGIFVLVRTSNPGSSDLQDQKIDTGETLSEVLANKLQVLAGAKRLMGDNGYSNVGAVVGATQPQTMESLRRRLPNSYFLLPGYGTQGATADMTRAAFDKDGLGALVSASRSILYPKDSGDDWQSAIAKAAELMRKDLALIRGN